MPEGHLLGSQEHDALAYPIDKHDKGRYNLRIRMTNLSTQLAQLESAQLVRRLLDEDAAYLFKHALTQESAYDSLLVKRRRDLHRRVAQAYEALYPEHIDELAAVLAQHYSEAGDDAKSLEYATRAADQAARVYANNEAINYYSRALEAAERLEVSGERLRHLYIRRGRAYELNGQSDLALDNYNEMQAAARARGDRSLELESFIRCANLFAMATSVYNPALAQELADRALTIAHPLGDRAAESRVLWSLLILNRYGDQALRAIEYGEQALALARELELREETAFILTDLGGVYMESGQLEHAQILLDEARSLWRELNNRPMLADNLMVSGVHAMLSGNDNRALSFTSEGAEISKHIGNVIGQESNQGLQIWIWTERGDFGLALDLANENLRLAEKETSHFILALAASTLASLYAAIGVSTRAADMARLAEANLDQSIPPYFHGLVFANLALAHISSGDLNGADAMMTPIRAESGKQITLSPRSMGGIVAEGELALAKGEFVHVAVQMQEFATILQSLGVHFYLALVLYFEGEALRRQGQMEPAREILEQARTEAQAHESRATLWQIYASLSEIERERGNETRAIELNAQAQSVVAYIVEHTPAEFRESFLALPRVRRVMASEQE